MVTVVTFIVKKKLDGIATMEIILRQMSVGM